MLLQLQILGMAQEEIVTSLVNAAITVVVFLVSLALIYLVAKPVASRIVRETLEQRDYQPALVDIAVSTTIVFTLVLSVALAATVAGFGVVLSAFAILGGALALAVGFASQNLISNFVAGVFIVRDEPFGIGDWIKWDGNSGTVREIQLRVTKVETFDEELVTVPNSHLANAAVTNPVASDRLRVSYDFGIDYDDDIDQARALILDEAGSLDDVLDDPAPSAPVVDLGDSAVVLSGRLWINPNETGAAGIRAALVEGVKKRFDAEGINMPYHNTELSGEIHVRDPDAADASA